MLLVLALFSIVLSILAFDISVSLSNMSVRSLFRKVPQSKLGVSGETPSITWQTYISPLIH